VSGGHIDELLLYQGTDVQVGSACDAYADESQTAVVIDNVFVRNLRIQNFSVTLDCGLDATPTPPTAKSISRE
jgi:hypothetical protein